jgi:hypothetical protein
VVGHVLAIVTLVAPLVATAQLDNHSMMQERKEKGVDEGLSMTVVIDEGETAVVTAGETAVAHAEGEAHRARRHSRMMLVVILLILCQCPQRSLEECHQT